MKALVTGGSGYLGRKLIPLLKGEVHLLDRFPPHGSGFRFIQGDIRDKGLDLSPFDSIFHLAAMSLPSAVESDRDAAWDVNVNGTMNICRRMRPGQCLVFMSSSHVYDRSLAGPHKEAELPSPGSFYGLTKLVGEQAVRYHSRTIGFKAIILRLFNSYSADQPKGLLVGDVIEKYRSGKRVEIRNPSTMLDMVHAEDAARVISEAPSFPDGTYNVCTGRGVAVGEIYAAVRKREGARSEEAVVSDKAYSLLGDNSKLAALGYSFRGFGL